MRGMLIMRIFLSTFGLQCRWMFGIALLFSQQIAMADVWGYIDDKGVAHFAAERLDERYEIFFQASGAGFPNGIGGATGGLADASSGAAGASNGAAAGPTPRQVTVPTAPHKLLAFFDVSPAFKVVKHHLREASRQHRVDYELLQALIATESGFDGSALSPKGAVGLMQVMPDTGRRYGLRDDKLNTVSAKLIDAKTNIATGTRYLRDLMNLYPGKLDLALAAYNAGAGAVQRAGNKVPNFRETQNYVATVIQLYNVLKPPVAVAEHRNAAQRVRLSLTGGASQRGNMPAGVGGAGSGTTSNTASTATASTAPIASPETP